MTLEESGIAEDRDSSVQARATRFAGSATALWIAVAGLAVVALTVLGMTAYQQSTYAWADHSRIVYQTTRTALYELERAERELIDEGHRGVTSTADTSEMRGAVVTRLDSVVALTVDNPRQNSGAQQLRDDAIGWWNAVASAIATSSPMPVDSLAGRVTAANASGQRFLAEENRLHDLRIRHFKNAETATAVITILEVVFVILILLAYARRSRQFVQRVTEQRVQLEGQSAELQNQAAELEAVNQELNESMRATQQALGSAESEARERARALALLDASLDSAPIAIAVLDRDLRFVRVNRPWAELNDMSPEEHLGRRLTDLPFSAEALTAAVPFLERCLADAVVASNVELSGCTIEDDTHRRFWLMSCAPVSVEAFGQIGVVAALLDVTARTRLSEEFLQIQKMEAVGRLAGGIAHDFNNSLAVINAYASMLMMSKEATDIDRSRAEEIIGAVDRAASLTQQLLAFGRRQISSPRTIDLNDVVRRMSPMLIRIIPAPIQLSTRLDAIPATVLIDPSQLEQVIMNLVSNAIHAMVGGGSLEIATDAIELDESYAAAHAAVVAGRYVLLTVSDTGAGMDEETLRRVFEPFFTTKEAGHGSGLGLASVYAIVRGAHGYIWPYSEYGKGSTFKIYLPHSSAIVAPASTAIVRDHSEEDATILLVEDDAKLRPAVARLLEQSGYHVVQAASGEAALAALADRPASIDLVLTDLVMPGLTGRELSERINAEFPGVPILFTSGYTDDIVIRQGLIERGFPFVQKPFTRDQLLAAVNTALAAE